MSTEAWERYRGRESEAALFTSFLLIASTFQSRYMQYERLDSMYLITTLQRASCISSRAYVGHSLSSVTS